MRCKAASGEGVIPSTFAPASKEDDGVQVLYRWNYGKSYDMKEDSFSHTRLYASNYMVVVHEYISLIFLPHYIFSPLEEINYVHTLNRLLPDDIRALAWAPVPSDFNARYVHDK